MKKLFYLLIICTVSLSAIGMQSCNNNKLYDINPTVKGENQALVENDSCIFSGNLSAELTTKDDSSSTYNSEVNFYKDGKPLPYDDEYDFTQDDFIYILSIDEFAPWSSNHEGLSKKGREKCIIYLREAPFKDSVIVDGINITESLNKAHYDAKGKMNDWSWDNPKRSYGKTIFTGPRFYWDSDQIYRIIVDRSSNGGLTIDYRLDYMSYIRLFG